MSVTIISSGYDLKKYAEILTETHNIPGCSLAIYRGEEIEQAGAGCCNLDTGVRVTPDSVFQIGSITKVMTSCLVMQLVDEGKLLLDVPVKHYLRDFMIGDSEASLSITVRQLLNHTSGMAGDFFPDDQGQEGNLIARYVDRCNLLPLLHQPGAHYSYCNSGFVIAGRLVEVLRGISWYQAMQDYIFKPLKMSHAIADPKDIIRHRAAMGHLWNGSDWEVSKQAWLPLGMAPCGTSPTMTARDLIKFALAHLRKVEVQPIKSWLSNGALSAMQGREFKLPDTHNNISLYSGLGWGLREYHSEGILVCGHTGATNGFYSSLQICPERNAAFAVLINGAAPDALQGIQHDLVKEVFGIEMPQEPALDIKLVLKLNQLSVVGRYESMDKIIVICESEEQLSARVDYKIDLLPPEELLLFPISEECYACTTFDGKRRPSWTFLKNDSLGPLPTHLFDGSRLHSYT